MGPAIGLYLVMTGRILNGKEAKDFGVATNYMEEKNFVDLKYALNTVLFPNSQQSQIKTIVDYFSEQQP